MEENILLTQANLFFATFRTVGGAKLALPGPFVFGGQFVLTFVLELAMQRLHPNLSDLFLSKNLPQRTCAIP